MAPFESGFEVGHIGKFAGFPSRKFCLFSFGVGIYRFPDVYVNFNMCSKLFCFGVVVFLSFVVFWPPRRQLSSGSYFVDNVGGLCKCTWRCLGSLGNIVDLFRHY